MRGAVINWLAGNQFVTEMLGACFVVILPHRKRSHFNWRAVIFCLTVELISLLLMNSVPAKNIWQDSSYVVVSSIIYVFVFAGLSILFFLLCCPLTVQELAYCVALSLCIQHFSSSLRLMFKSLLCVEKIFIFFLWLLSTVLPYCLFYQLCVRKICEKGAYRISAMQLTIVTLLIFFVSALISIVAKGIDPGLSSPLFLLCQIYEMLCCFFLLWLQVYQVKSLQLQKRLDIQEYLLHSQLEQGKKAKENMKMSVHLMHELKHQVSDMLMADGEDNRNDILDRIADNLSVYDEIVTTKNETLDLVLQERNLYCRANHIRLMCVVDGKLLSFLSAESIYLIFRNALDNAIESVMQQPDERHRIIDIKVYNKARFLYIQIENPFKGRLIWQGELPATTKKDNDYHGFGLQTIQAAVEKHNGSMTIHTIEERFSLRIVIPIPRS